MRRTGFTLVELMCATALASVVITIVVLLFGFAAVRTTDAYARTSLWDQLNSAADDIEGTIREAHSCSVTNINSGSVIQCVMPVSANALDGNGQWDTYNPSTTTAEGHASYTTGKTIWYYLTADSAGGYGVSGNGASSLWRAITSSSSNPQAADLDTTYSKYYAGTPRFSLISSFTATVDSSTRSVSFTLTANSAIGRTQQDSTGESNRTRTLVISRTIVWRNWE